MTAQHRHEEIKKIARDPNITDADALRKIAKITPHALAGFSFPVHCQYPGCGAGPFANEFQVDEHITEDHLPEAVWAFALENMKSGHARTSQRGKTRDDETGRLPRCPKQGTLASCTRPAGHTGFCNRLMRSKNQLQQCLDAAIESMLDEEGLHE